MHTFYSEKNYSYGRAFLITDVKKNVSLGNMKHRSVSEDESFYKKEIANSSLGPSVMRFDTVLLGHPCHSLSNSVNGYIV